MEEVLKFHKRSFLAAAALAALAQFSMPAQAANMIGNCEVTGEKADDDSSFFEGIQRARNGLMGIDA